MKVIITGGSGFLGLRLMSAILDKKKLIGHTGKPELVKSIILLDTSSSALPAKFDDDRVSFIEGNITDGKLLKSIINGDSVWKPHALFLLGDYFVYKKEFLKAKEFYLQILTLKNLHKEFYEEAQLQLSFIENE